MSESPPWEVLELVAQRLDPKAVASAACVCKSWSLFMCSDHLWRSFCSAAFPSLLNLRAAVPAPVSYRKLYSIGCAAELRRRYTPPRPHFSLKDFFFAVDIYATRHAGVLMTVVKPGSELDGDADAVFRFDIDVAASEMVAFQPLEDSLRVTWSIVLGDFEGVFTVMDCVGNGSFVMGLEGWFSKELPSRGCCSGGAGSGLVAELRMGLRRRDDGNVVMEKMSLGILSIVSWRYVTVDDALRYLQHFLPPPHLV